VAPALQLHWRPFALALPRPLRTAHGTLSHKRGWLLQLRTAGGQLGWGEAAPLDQGGQAGPALAAAISALGRAPERAQLEQALAAGALPGPLAFALGGALAEADGLLAAGWLAAPPSAQLLPAGAAAVASLEAALQALQGGGAASHAGLSFKWKVAVHSDSDERAVLEQLLARLPAQARLRLDANGHWPRPMAAAWAERLAAEPRLQWLEQPLAPADQAGLDDLAQRLPVALDESLRHCPDLRRQWSGWQVRRPSQEGDPRPLLAELGAGRPRLMLSTAFETGIGRRWLHHLAALQAQGPTPAAPGLAPGWQPSGPLLATDPSQVWQAAA
jgi:O-succinylbenzoate synthase